MRTFVIGDVHGQSMKLRRLVVELQKRASRGDALVFVGDYIDRGTESRMVVEQVLALMGGEWNGPVTTLKGNHEELLLDALSRRPRYGMDVWIQNGGRETVISYSGSRDPRSFAGALPQAHLAFYQALKSWHEDENGIYVHAGIPPGMSPAEATDDDLLWIREPFIDSDYQWDKVVVFGHTPQYEPSPTPVLGPSRLAWRPLDRPEKIGIDTGVAYGGPLSAVVLPEREFVAVR